jgi:pyruvate/2-oxoglutarate/acetoin dehydrogenase E1 component
MTQKNYATAINEALHLAMQIDESVICYGLGVTDPKAVFGTTEKLEARFGPKRVFDTPTSENAMTGIAIGAALNGIKSVVTHQRVDFFLLAMDQLVNGAAKWHYMFGGQNSVPITIRLIIGRGWGQGPTHSQNLQAWFSHIPGLKVVMPSTPEDAKGLLLSAIFDPNPVIFLEHRWLHNTVGEVPQGDFRIPIGKAKLVKTGIDITLVAMSYMTIEALHAANYLQQKGISCEVIDLRSIKPLDWDMVIESVNKTGRLLVLDSGFTTGSVAGEIIARITIELFKVLKSAPARLAMPDVPEPTSFALTKGFYITAADVATKVLEMLGKNKQIKVDLSEPIPHDIPGNWFKGPF